MPVFYPCAAMESWKLVRRVCARVVVPMKLTVNVKPRFLRSPPLWNLISRGTAAAGLPTSLLSPFAPCSFLPPSDCSFQFAPSFTNTTSFLPSSLRHITRARPSSRCSPLQLPVGPWVNMAGRQYKVKTDRQTDRGTGHQRGAGGGHIYLLFVGVAAPMWLSKSPLFFFTLTLHMEGIFQSAERFISESNNQ